MRFTLLMITLLLSFSVFATDRFDNSKLFVKLTPNGQMPKHALIHNTKHLFATNYLVTTPNAKLLASILNDNRNVQSTQLNFISEKSKLPKIKKVKMNSPMDKSAYFNDPQVGRVWAFRDAKDNGVSVEKSYQSPLNVNKEDIIVAVVDTGVDYNHEDLKNIMWKNENEIEGNGIDDDGNGYIDDIYGIDPLSDDTDPMASHAHGTHVAGTIAAEQNNRTGIAGIASQVKIMAIRTVPDSSDETDADVVESFLYAAKHGARIINCSFGKRNNEGGMIVNETIDHIGKTYKTLVIAAAGNDYGRDIDSRLVYPASFPSDYLMVVASTTKSGGLSWFSNIGKKNVDVAAPGSGVYSTTPGNSYGNMSGTSMASPTTAGVAAEVLSHFPNLDAVSLKNVLIKSVTKVNSFKDKMVSGGRVDLHNTLQYTFKNLSDILQQQSQRNGLKP
jgi:thermitase